MDTPFRSCWSKKNGRYARLFKTQTPSFCNMKSNINWNESQKLKSKCHEANTPYRNYDLSIQVLPRCEEFSDKSTETTLHKMSVQVFLRFSDSSKPDQFVSLILDFVWLARFRKSEENLLKTSWTVGPVIKDNQKESACASGHWCDVSWDIPYLMVQ